VSDSENYDDFNAFAEQFVGDKCYKNNVMIIYFIYVQHMNHSQEHSEYDLMTNSEKFIRQMTLSLSEGDSSFCN